MRYYEVNKVTGEKKLIRNTDIISVNRDYILIKPSDSNAAAKMIYDYVTEDELTSLSSIELKQADYSMFPDTSSTGDNKYMYNVGIENITVEKRIPEKVCGYITGAISIGSCSYIELSVSRNNLSVPIEYSIIDGFKEVPIIPVEESGLIITEHLFFGQGLRFTPDKSHDIKIKKNGLDTSMSLDNFLSLTDIDKDNEVYTAEYMPINTSSKYSPSNNLIKIKIIERCYDNIPSVVNTLVIKKHGGEKPWII